MKDRIKELRRTLGLTQDEFGSRIGITKSSISTMESGKSNPSDQTIRSICREFGVSYKWLTNGQRPMFENGQNDIALHSMVDRIMASENEWVKQIFKGLGNLTQDDWKQINDILDKLLAGEKPWEDKIPELYLDGQKNIAAARSGDREEPKDVPAEEEETEAALLSSVQNDI